jgi:hypothetical protein
MSRHKIIKNLDLDDELDDFDGGEDYDYDGGAEGGIEGMTLPFPDTYELVLAKICCY